jgi:hypothetical protein
MFSLGLDGRILLLRVRVYVRDERWKTDISGKEENPNFPDLVFMNTSYSCFLELVDSTWMDWKDH